MFWLTVRGVGTRSRALTFRERRESFETEPKGPERTRRHFEGCHWMAAHSGGSRRHLKTVSPLMPCVQHDNTPFSKEGAIGQECRVNVTYALGCKCIRHEEGLGALPEFGYNHTLASGRKRHQKIWRPPVLVDVRVYWRHQRNRRHLVARIKSCGGRLARQPSRANEILTTQVVV